MDQGRQDLLKRQLLFFYLRLMREISVLWQEEDGVLFGTPPLFQGIEVGEEDSSLRGARFVIRQVHHRPGSHPELRAFSASPNTLQMDEFSRSAV